MGRTSPRMARRGLPLRPVPIVKHQSRGADRCAAIPLRSAHRCVHHDHRRKQPAAARAAIRVLDGDARQADRQGGIATQAVALAPKADRASALRDCGNKDWRSSRPRVRCSNMQSNSRDDRRRRMGAQGGGQGRCDKKGRCAPRVSWNDTRLERAIHPGGNGRVLAGALQEPDCHAWRTVRAAVLLQMADRHQDARQRRTALTRRRPAPAP